MLFIADIKIKHGGGNRSAGCFWALEKIANY